MMSKRQRYHEACASSKTNKPSQKSSGKDLGPSLAPVTSGGSGAKASLSGERSSSSAGGSVTRGSSGHHSGAGRQGARQARKPTRTAARLCSSLSSPSLPTSTLSTAPCMRSYRSLSRLDQDETSSENAAVGSKVKCRNPSSEGTAPGSDRLSSASAAGKLLSRAIVKDQRDGEELEKMEMNTSSELPSSAVSSAAGCLHYNKLKKQDRSVGPVPDVPQSSLPRNRRSKSLDCRNMEAPAIPDLLNFKKGWMMRQDADGQWQKHWFVLANQILRFYSDSVAEEAADMDGEINLSTCYDITDFPAQKNCGFQIHTKDGVYTLCAMTSGIRHNWVQAVLKNVSPTLTPDVTSSLPEQKTHFRPQGLESQPEELAENTDQASRAHEHFREGRYETSGGEEVLLQQQKESEVQQEREGDPVEDSSTLSLVSSSPLSSSSLSSAASQLLQDHPRQEEEGQESRKMIGQCPIISQTAGGAGTSPGVTDPQSEDGDADDSSSASTLEPPNDEGYDKGHNEQRGQQVEATPLRQEGQASISSISECSKDKEQPCYDQQTGQLVKELEQTQKELSRLQQLNRNLQHRLQQETQIRSRGVPPQKSLPLITNSSSADAKALQRLQKVNHDLHLELESQRRSQEEAREAELRRRVDLLAQQAQLLVTGDATAIACAQLEQDRRHFHERQVELERCVASLRSQLGISEEKRRQAETHVLQLQQETQGYQNLQKEADRLRERFQDMTVCLRANEEAQAQKEVRLQKHLLLLQESQERERKSLSASLAQAERHAQDLQERLENAEQQVENLNKGQLWTREVQEAQQELQEELACTVSAVQRLQEEREQLKRHCQELQNQLAEVDGEVSRLQNRLKSEETQYYNLEHSYERVCEQLQLALGQVQSREAETQDIREGYEGLLDRKEQELSEVLVKMEILGNSLEETEVKLSEVLKACTCTSSQLKDASSQSPQLDDEQQGTALPLLTQSDNRPTVRSINQPSTNLTDVDVAPLNDDDSKAVHARTRSRSVDPSYQYIITAGDDPDRFMSVIQCLETKLYVTEERLRDITQKLEEQQSHISCPDPHLYSQLTQSRATAQHLSLLLHNQVKQGQRFAQDTENRSRVLVERFRAAMKILEACREGLQTRLKNLEERTTGIDTMVLEKQLATAVACLQQGEYDAEKQQEEACNTSKEDRMINDETYPGAEIRAVAKSRLTKILPSGEELESIGTTLMKEAFVAEKIVSVLQSPLGIRQLHLVAKGQMGDLANRYKSTVSQIIALEMEREIQQEKAGGDDSEFLENTVRRICVEAEVVYAALKLQQQYDCMSQGDLQTSDQAMERLWQNRVKCEELTFLRRRSLADVNPPELAPYEEQVQREGRGLEEDGKDLDNNQSAPNQAEGEKKGDWLDRLVSQLQRRAKVLRQLCQEIANCGRTNKESVDCSGVNDSAIDLKWVQDQVMLIYLSDRLYLDVELELQQSKQVCDRLQATCQEQDIALVDEQQAFGQTLSQLQEDNSVLQGQLMCAEQNRIAAESGNQRLLEGMQKIEAYHDEKMQNLEKEFQEKINELQQIHEEEMKHLHSYYNKSACIHKDTQTNSCSEVLLSSETVSSLSDLTPSSDLGADELKLDRQDDHFKLSSTETKDEQTHESVVNVRTTKEELRNRMFEMDAAGMRETYQREFEKLKASYDEGFTTMEAMHKKLVRDLQQQHQREVADLLKEKDQQLKEETAATMTAIVAMRKAHKEELEKSRWSQQIRESTDIAQIHIEYEKEIQSLREELEVLSAQHTQKCLEYSQLSHELQAETRTWVRGPTGDQEPQNKQDDKTYPQNKLHPLYTDIQEKARHDVPNKYATWSPQAHSRESSTAAQRHEDLVTAQSDAVFLKKPERTSLTRQIRVVRSKSLKEGLSIQERMKLFESF